MNSLESSFAHLLGRQPTDTDRQKLYRVKEALDLDNNDALWLVLMVLQHYETLYATIPERISEAAEETLDQFRTTAESTARSAAQSARADLAKAVSTASREVADHVAAIKRYQSLSWAALAVGAALCAVLGFGYTTGTDAGQRVGYAAGYRAAADLKAATTWVETPEGKLAWELAKTGALRDLATCGRPGWRVEDGVCYVHRGADGFLYGWRVSAGER